MYVYIKPELQVYLSESEQSEYTIASIGVEQKECMNCNITVYQMLFVLHSVLTLLDLEYVIVNNAQNTVSQQFCSLCTTVRILNRFNTFVVILYLL